MSIIDSPRSESKDYVYLGLGSNLGARREHLRKAVSVFSRIFVAGSKSAVAPETEQILVELRGREGLEILTGLLSAVTGIELSPIYETKAWGNSDQADFLNCVARLEFPKLRSFSYQEQIEFSRRILELNQSIEKHCGRDRASESKWVPRVLDIDILMVGDLIYQSKELTVPHPYLRERGFVLKPLLDISPQICYPGTDNPLKTDFEKLEDNGCLRRIDFNLLGG